MKRSCLVLSVMMFPALFLSACTLVDLEPEPLAIFDLRAVAVAAAEQPGIRAVAVAPPEALAPLASDRIAVRGADGALGVLAGARWAGSGPRLVQDLLLRGLEDAGAVASASRLGAGARHDCVLGGDLRAFEYLRGEGRVRVALRARLTCGAAPGRAVHRAFEASAPVRSSGAASVVGAFDAALADLVPAVVAWFTEEEG